MLFVITDFSVAAFMQRACWNNENEKHHQK